MRYDSASQTICIPHLDFQHQAPLVKLQIITLAAKLLVLSPAHPTLRLLAQYVFSLARYDQNYDVRDRARMLSSLLGGLSPSSSATNGVAIGETLQEQRPGVVLRREQVQLVLFEGKSEVADVDDGRGLGMYLRLLTTWVCI
jgi:AP-3 complex subunit beta